jgi:hypothetical protein
MQLQAQYPKHLIIPEGGANLFGVRGCIEILEETDFTPEIVAAPLGSATTFSGLVLSAKPQTELWGFPAVKGGAYLRNTVNNFITKAKETGLVPATFPSPKWQLITSYHFGGFAKTTPAFIHFLNAFYAETGIPLDPIYSGKMMYGLLEEVKAGRIKPGSTVLVLHTGGLQGISGMNQRLRKRICRLSMKKLLLVLFLIPLINLAQSRRQTYIDTYKDIAIREMKIYHIPASITLAQGILESGDGQSRLATKANNHFGIKCHNGWTGAGFITMTIRKGSASANTNMPKKAFAITVNF